MASAYFKWGIDMETMDCLGLKCPEPVQRVAAKAKSMAEGDILEVVADCPNFEDDLRKWSDRTGHMILSIMEEGEAKRAQIQF